MKKHIILEDGKKYSGKYVALQSFKHRNVVSSGNDMKAVLKNAQSKGYSNPVVFYVPKKGMANIY